MRSGPGACGQSAPAMPGRAWPMRRGNMAFRARSSRSRQRRRPSSTGCARSARQSCRCRTNARGWRRRAHDFPGSRHLRPSVRQSRLHRRSWHDGAGDPRRLPGRPHRHLRDRGRRADHRRRQRNQSEEAGAKVLGAEPETAAPYALSLREGGPQKFGDWQASFVDGAGGQSVIERMWQRMRPVTDGAITVTLKQAPMRCV